MNKFILFSVVLMLMICIIGSYVFVKHYNALTYSYEKEIYKFDNNLRNAYGIIDSYQSYSSTRIISDDTVKCLTNDVVSLEEVLQHKKLILWFSNYSCSSCYNREFEYLRSKIIQGNTNLVIFVSGFENNRSFSYEIKEAGIEKFVFIVDTFITDNSLIEKNIPFVATIDSELYLNRVTFLDKKLPFELTKKSIDVILSEM